MKIKQPEKIWLSVMVDKRILKQFKAICLKRGIGVGGFSKAGKEHGKYMLNLSIEVFNHLAAYQIGKDYGKLFMEEIFYKDV